MFHKTIFVLISLFIVVALPGQPTFNTSTAHIHIEATTSFLTIDADNYEVSSLFNIATGQLIFEGALKDFDFDMSGMSTLFTSKFADHPSFRYEGTVINIAQISPNIPGKYPVNFKGILEFGGKKRTIPGTGVVVVDTEGSITAASDLSFMISEQTVKKMNALIASYMPFGFGLSMERLGFSREVKVVINGKYEPTVVSKVQVGAN